jgi:hypothetical protein
MATVKALVEYHLRGAAQEDRCTDCNDDEHDCAATARRLDGEAVQRKAHNKGEKNRQNGGQG